jgi:hypothetical protein
VKYVCKHERFALKHSGIAGFGTNPKRKFQKFFDLIVFFAYNLGQGEG